MPSVNKGHGQVSVRDESEIVPAHQQPTLILNLGYESGLQAVTGEVQLNGLPLAPFFSIFSFSHFRGDSIGKHQKEGCIWESWERKQVPCFSCPHPTRFSVLCHYQGLWLWGFEVELRTEEWVPGVGAGHVAL